MTDMRGAIEPKSDQLNADDLIAGPIIITITGVTVTKSKEQPVTVSYEGDQGKPWKPSKGMSRIMVLMWGRDARAYVGKRLRLFRDPTVLWAGEPVGGIRISHASDIPEHAMLAVTLGRGKKKPFEVGRLEDLPEARALTVDVADELGKMKAQAARGKAELEAAWNAAGPAVRKALAGELDGLKEIAGKAQPPAEHQQQQQEPQDGRPAEAADTDDYPGV